jgi:hypothetical protein
MAVGPRARPLQQAQQRVDGGQQQRARRARAAREYRAQRLALCDLLPQDLRASLTPLSYTPVIVFKAQYSQVYNVSAPGIWQPCCAARSMHVRLVHTQVTDASVHASKREVAREAAHMDGAEEREQQVQVALLGDRGAQLAQDLLHELRKERHQNALHAGVLGERIQVQVEQLQRQLPALQAAPAQTLAPFAMLKPDINNVA